MTTSFFLFSVSIEVVIPKQLHGSPRSYSAWGKRFFFYNKSYVRFCWSWEKFMNTLNLNGMAHAWRENKKTISYSAGNRTPESPAWQVVYLPLYNRATQMKLVFLSLVINSISWTKDDCVVAERTSYFCLARKLIWPLWSSHIFTPWGWLILFSPDYFPGQHKNGESPPNYLFLTTFRAGRTYFLSAPFIAAESQHREESRLIYGPLSLLP